MSREFHIIRKQDLTTTRWSGGTTTQLAIWPPQAEYAARNFIWRISTAKIEEEESQFTDLPGVSRILMPLDGTLRVEHPEHHNIVLKPFEQDRFMGDWPTRSYGRVTDFNLMMTTGSGSVEAMRLNPEEEVLISLCHMESEWRSFSDVFYFLGSCQLEFAGHASVRVDAGDVLLITRSNDNTEDILRLTNRSGESVLLIRATIFFG